MTNHSTTSLALQSEAESAVLLDDWFDPIEAGLRDRVREFIQAMIESELEAALVRPRYGRRPKADANKGSGPDGISDHRHGHRSRVTDGDLWPGRDCGTAGQARYRGGQDSRVEEQGAASLSAPDQACRFADRWRLPWRDQYASGAAGPL